MKKILFVIFTLIVSTVVKVYAEDHRIYAVVVFNGSSQTPVLIQETTDAGSSWSGFNFKENYLRDENGKELKFNNFLPALGYLEKIGWIIPDIQDQIIRNMPNTINGRSTFLLYKDVSEDEWLQWIENGIRTK